MTPIDRHRSAEHPTSRTMALLALACLLASVPTRHSIGQDQSSAATAPVRKPAASTPRPSEIGDQVRAAVDSASTKKGQTLMINGKEKKYITMPPGTGAQGPAMPATGAKAVPATASTAAQTLPVPPGAIPNPVASRQYIRARAAALAGHAGPPATDGAGEAHWSYDGATGPQAWGRLRPEFKLCAVGRRQSPINIEESATLQGPAEPIRFNYPPSSASVVNNGHTIQVDVAGDNVITVRGSDFKLLQFHFHHPSEERVNSQGFSMVAHLVHRNAEGQLAVVAVLLEPGAANPLINNVWTYMPLDAGDRVRMPGNSLELAQLLPRDQRYYQFIGSLTTPPCTEGVLWLVLKQPMTLSREQLRLFAQLFPNNARPVQPVNGRPVRDAQ